MITHEMNNKWQECVASVIGQADLQLRVARQHADPNRHDHLTKFSELDVATHERV